MSAFIFIMLHSFISSLLLTRRLWLLYSVRIVAQTAECSSATYELVQVATSSYTKDTKLLVQSTFGALQRVLQRAGPCARERPEPGVVSSIPFVRHM